MMGRRFVLGLALSVATAAPAAAMSPMTDEELDAVRSGQTFTLPDGHVLEWDPAAMVPTLQLAQAVLAQLVNDLQRAAILQTGRPTFPPALVPPPPARQGLVAEVLRALLRAQAQGR